MIKEKIKKLPIIGSLFLKLIHKIKGVPVFKNSGQYWEERYKKGGNSGAGSYDKLAMFKGETINQFVAKNNIKTVVELGCGDGNQLKYFNFSAYLGYDVSQTAISLCKNLYKEDQSKQFKLLKDYTIETADLSLSLDVIYHLIEEETYLDYMEKLFACSNKFVIVYSSNTTDTEDTATHVKYRKFTDWVQANAPEFKLLKQISNDYPFDGNQKETSISDFYFFAKA